MPKSLINIKVVTNIVGSLIIITGVLMSLTIPISIVYKGGALMPLILSSAITLTAGLLIKFSTRYHKDEKNEMVI